MHAEGQWSLNLSGWHKGAAGYAHRPVPGTAFVTIARMFPGIRRREFLAQASQAVAGFPLLLGGCSSQPPVEPVGQSRRSWREALARIEERIPRAMEENKVPGLSMVLIEDAKVAWRGVFGVKDAATKAPVDHDTMFESASMSKPVFAYAVMKLVEDRKLDLDRPLTAYTPERFLKGDPRLDLITARHALSHTTGFPNWRSDAEPLKIQFAPGSKWSYSGEGYSYLQSVVARLTGRPIEPYMKANLFAPFAMASSGYLWTPEFAGRMARPHGTVGNPKDNKKSAVADVARYGSSGALLATPSDYAKFLIEVIDPKPPDAFRLSRDSLKEMTRPQVKVDAYLFKSSWALGWQIRHSANGDFICHGGDNDGFHAMCAASMERKSGVVIMTNGENGWQLIQRQLMDDLIRDVL